MAAETKIPQIDLGPSCQGGKSIHNTQGFLWQLLQGASTHHIKSNHFQLLNATQDLLAGNKRAQGSYLAVANIAQAFPQLQAEVCLKSLIVESLMKQHPGTFACVPGTVRETAPWTLPLAGAERPL